MKELNTQQEDLVLEEGRTYHKDKEEIPEWMYKEI